MIASLRPTPPTKPTAQTARSEFVWALREARVPELRSMVDWAAQEIIIPDGPLEGELFNPDFAPWTRLWLEAVNSGNWLRFVAVGPAQSGKTLVCFVIPTSYHLFEVGEKVIGGVPTEEMARDKWDDDIRPAIRSSRSYAKYLPESGRGSEGGFATSVRFKNNRVLKWMTGGGKNSKRAGYTSRVVVITETDQFSTPTLGSIETDKIRQLEARTQAYGARAAVYMECTVTTKRGRIWQEYTSGTASQIVVPCPHCSSWVRPERKHLIGWQTAADEFEAMDNGHFICPACEHPITEEERRAMLPGSKLLHKGQAIEADGTITGDLPRTNTLGFRWSAFDNPFVTTRYLAAEEWRGQQAGTDEAEKRLCQLIWAFPFDDGEEFKNTVDLNLAAITNRQRPLNRGELPPETTAITIGIDVGLRFCHWVAIAWIPGGLGHLVDYQTVGVPEGDRMMAEQAVHGILLEMTEELSKGWARADGEMIPPDFILVDAGYKTDVVYEAVRGKHAGRTRILAYMGFGGNQSDYMTVQQRPKNTNNVQWVGDQCQIAAIQHAGIYLVEGDSDFWKMRVHEAFAGPVDQAGSLTLFHRPSFEHNDYGRNILAEEPVEEQRPGGGRKIRFHVKSRQNHKLDCTYMAMLAGHMAGACWMPKKKAVAAAVQEERPASKLTTPDGRPYSVLSRKEDH